MVKIIDGLSKKTKHLPNSVNKSYTSGLGVLMQ